MAEVLAEYPDVVIARTGRRYTARACGARWRPGNGTAGWSSSTPRRGTALRSPRETTQPNRVDTVYWATGLTAVYLEGALERALHPLTRPRRVAPPHRPSTARRRISSPEPPVVDSILNPFSVYRKGEALLRRQLDRVLRLAPGQHRPRSSVERSVGGDAERACAPPI